MQIPDDEQDLIGESSPGADRRAGPGPLLTSRYGTTGSSQGSVGSRSDGEGNVGAAERCEEVDSEAESEATGGPGPGRRKADQWSFQCLRREGNLRILGEWTSAKKAQVRLLVLGPDGWCVLATYFCLAAPCVLLLQWGIRSPVLRAAFIASAAACFLAMSYVVLSDPGAVRAYSRARTNKWRYCDHCESYRPPDAVHCSSCDVCISGYDHHCPWTGKCVGSANHRSFRAFTASVSWLLLACFCVLLVKLSEDVDGPRA